MSFLRFFPDEVQLMAQRLESSGEDMKTASKRLLDAEARQLGTDGLASSCEDFADSWDYGFGQLSELTKGVCEFADECVRTFAQLEDDLEHALRSGGTA